MDGTQVLDGKKRRPLRGGGLRTLQTDVVIVGGGPAGCGTALAVRQLGLSAVVVSSARDSDKPTETSLPALRHMLRMLGAEQALGGCEPCYGISSRWGRTESELSPGILNPQGNAWFVHRKRFDALLRESVKESGAFWMDGIASGGTFEPDASTVFTNDADVRAKWLVIATGAPTWAARFTGEKIIKQDLLTAFWGKIPYQRSERLLFIEPSQFGWWYLCPDDGPGSVACLVTDPLTARDIGAGKLSNWNDLFCSTCLSNGAYGTATDERVFAMATGVMSLSKASGDRWIAVGDAAARLDPLGSSGIMTALDGGRRAARAIANSLKGEPAERHKYQKWSETLVWEFSRQRKKHYLLEASKRSTHFWDRYRSASSL